MNSDDLYDQFFQQLNQTFSGAQAISGELQQHLRSAMMSTFSKLELVSQEEFDTQRAVLMRSREKIDALEKQLAELEAAFKEQAAK